MSDWPEIVLRDEPETVLAALAHLGPYPRIGETFDKLYPALVQAGLRAEACGEIAIYFDDMSKVAPEDLRSLAGVVVGSKVGVPFPLERFVIPAGRAAVYTYRGAYGGIAAAWGRFCGPWLSQGLVRPAPRPAYERYLKDVTTTAPEDLVTELILPIL